MDEIANREDWQKITKWLNQQTQNYLYSRFIITTRPFSSNTFFPIELGDLFKIKLLRFDQVKQFIQIVLDQSDSSLKECKPTIFGYIRSNKTLLRLVSNPLLLYMVLAVFNNSSHSNLPLYQSFNIFSDQLVIKCTNLYDSIIENLLGLQKKKELTTATLVLEKKRLLSRLSLQLMKQQKTEFIQTESIQNLTYTKKLIEDTEVIQIDEFGGLVVENTRNKYSFVHQTFQEYLAAFEIIETKQEELLLQNITNSWWRETIRFYVAQAEDPTKIFQAMRDGLMDSLSIGNCSLSIYILSLAWDCIREDCKVSETVQQLKEMINSGMELTNSEIFKLTATVKLSSRLQELVSLNNEIDIDTSPVTCAEYQLFINQKEKEGEYKQPDFWMNMRFDNGFSLKPVMGLRQQDVLEFYKWLENVNNEGDFSYRLPTLAELAKIKVDPAEQTIDYWHLNEATNKITGISDNQWQKAQQKLLRSCLEKTFNLDLEIANLQLTLAFALKVDLPRVIDLLFNVDSNNIIDFTELRNLAMGMDISLSADEINFNEADVKVACQTSAIDPSPLNGDSKYIYNSFKPLFDLADDILDSLRIEIEHRWKRYPTHLDGQKSSFLNTNSNCSSYLYSEQFSPIRSCLLLMYALWQKIAAQCEQTANEIEGIDRKEWIKWENIYKKRSEAITRIYKRQVIVDEQRRQMGKENLFPSWGGIWIVREKSE